jgi:uncharacterized protein YdhG (YjbR/CyaY superfamily)
MAATSFPSACLKSTSASIRLPKELVKEAGAYVGAKSSLHFPFDEPIPYDLIEKVVRFRAKRSKS